jgi:hypothetical protein
MEPVEEVDWAWLAGFIDGEGSLGIHRERDARKGADYFHLRPAIQISQVHRAPLDYARRLLGFGKIIRTKHRNNANARDCHIFSVRRQRDVLALLEGISPYLRLKLPHAAWLAQFCRNRSQQRGRGRRAPYEPCDLYIFNQLKMLNQRGRS